MLKVCVGTSLVGQQLRPRVSNAESVGLIPGQGTKILNAMWCGQKKKKKVCKWFQGKQMGPDPQA